MADYWKSQLKFYCSICNCYMADNRVTRDKHEGGKNHQENVERHLREIRMKSLQEEREKRMTEDCLKRMNRGAAVSSAQDAAESKPGSYSAAAAAAAATGYVHGNATPAAAAAAAAAAADAADSAHCQQLLDWKESKTADGRIYYWNTKTKETVWEKPGSANSAAVAASAAASQQQKAKLATKIRVLGGAKPAAEGPSDRASLKRTLTNAEAVDSDAKRAK